jgi:arylsulfatase
VAVARHARVTPLLSAAKLSERAGREVLLKLERLQHTGSFKVRGAANRLEALTPEERARGVVACSSGNHGRAVAYVAGRLGVPATIFVPEWVDSVKLGGIEAAGAEARREGATFDDSEAPSRRVTQYFEMLGHRSLYHGGWRAVCPWPGTSFAEGLPFGTPIPAEKLTELDATGWELFHVAEDFAENHDVSAENRGRLIEMIAQWYVEAGRYNVLPVDGRGQQRFADERPVIAVDRTRYTYYRGTQEVPLNAAPRILNRPHTIHADVVVPEGGADGVLVSQGGVDGGFSFYVKGRRLHYTYNYVAERVFRIVSDVEVPAGHHVLSLEFEPTGEPEMLKGKGSPGILTLFIDGEQVGRGELPVTIPITFGLAAGVSIGEDAGAPVTDDYRPPFPFAGTINGVAYDISGEPLENLEAEIRIALARQ